MVHVKLACFLVLVLSLAIVHGENRVARSPQFGGFSQARAQAQSQAGEFGRPYFGPRPPGFGHRPGFGPRPPVFGGNFGRPGGSISISKSVSISSGDGGRASSSADSNAFGK